MRYVINKKSNTSKINCCFYCKKKKPLSDFVIKEELAEYYRGVCTTCYFKYKASSYTYERSINGYKRSTLNIFIKFKEDYLRMESNYFKELDAKIKAKDTPTKKDTILKMLKFGVKKNYIYTYCKFCFKYLKSPPSIISDTNKNTKEIYSYQCNSCKYKIYKSKGIKRVYDPSKQRRYIKMWANTLKVDIVIS